MSADPMANPLPGGWYLGVSCSYCNEMVLFAPDESRGHGRLRFLEPDETMQQHCVRGHLTSFRLGDLRRFRWHQQLNS
jgi:hypothetical protein